MAALLSTLVLLPGAAQQQPPSPPPPTTDQPQLPTFRTGANLVRVDVTVLDHRGNAGTRAEAGGLSHRGGRRPAEGLVVEVHRGHRTAGRRSVAPDSLAGSCRRRGRARRRARLSHLLGRVQHRSVREHTSRARCADEARDDSLPADRSRCADGPADPDRRDPVHARLQGSRTRRAEASGPAGAARADAKRRRGRAAHEGWGYQAPSGGGDALGAEVGCRVPRDAARGQEGRDLLQRRSARPGHRRDDGHVRRRAGGQREQHCDLHRRSAGPHGTRRVRLVVSAGQQHRRPDDRQHERARHRAPANRPRGERFLSARLLLHQESGRRPVPSDQSPRGPARTRSAFAPGILGAERESGGGCESGRGGGNAARRGGPGPRGAHTRDLAAPSRSLDRHRAHGRGPSVDHARLEPAIRSRNGPGHARLRARIGHQ